MKRKYAMPDILMIEDDQHKQEIYGGKLRDNGHVGHFPIFDSIASIIESASEMARRRQFDVLVLDLSMVHLRRVHEADRPKLLWGGIDIYLGLRSHYVLDRCGHIIVASTYVADALRNSMPSSPHYVAKVFVELAEIPYENVICLNTGGGFDQVISRINALVA
jgi:CheY-like chemotaxis protein